MILQVNTTDLHHFLSSKWKNIKNKIGVCLFSVKCFLFYVFTVEWWTIDWYKNYTMVRLIYFILLSWYGLILLSQVRDRLSIKITNNIDITVFKIFWYFMKIFIVYFVISYEWKKTWLFNEILNFLKKYINNNKFLKSIDISSKLEYDHGWLLWFLIFIGINYILDIKHKNTLLSRELSKERLFGNVILCVIFLSNLSLKNQQYYHLNYLILIMHIWWLNMLFKIFNNQQKVFRLKKIYCSVYPVIICIYYTNYMNMTKYINILNTMIIFIKYIIQTYDWNTNKYTQIYKKIVKYNNIPNKNNILLKTTANTQQYDVNAKGKEAEEYVEMLLNNYFTYDVLFKQHEIATNKFIDFAIKINTADNISLFLPIDVKVHNKINGKFINSNDLNNVSILNQFSNRIISSAKSISEKYIIPNITTPFVILFLKDENLFNKFLQKNNDVVIKILLKYKVIMVSQYQLIFTVFFVKEIINLLKYNKINDITFSHNLIKNINHSKKIINQFIKQIIPTQQKIYKNIKMID